MQENMDEKVINASSGCKALILLMLFIVLDIVIFIESARLIHYNNNSFAGPFLMIASGVLLIIWFVLLGGLFIIQPNQGVALVLFGSYKGTIKKSGWYYANPFYKKRKVSLKSRNLNGEKLKVNDQMGNPVEIAAVVVWHVENTAHALFNVENYSDFVKIQSESAIRHIAGLYPYDTDEDSDKLSLRGSADEVSQALEKELQDRLSKAGVIIEEARLSHLAYAPEIAAAMLQRQQATAIIAAKQKIVEGAVGMVEMAITRLSENTDIELDDERKAAMVSNLMVVLCGEKAAQPVINTGTLHN